MPIYYKTAKGVLFLKIASFFLLLLLCSCSSNDTGSTEDLYISPQDAIQKSRNKTSIIVDTRDRASFACFHIPGSINVPGKGLLHKTFLKKKAVVLVTSGLDVPDALKTASEAKRHGVDEIKVIEGGIEAWHESMGELTRSPACSAGLYDVRPLSLLHILQTRGQDVVILAIDTCKSLRATFPNLKVVCISKKDLNRTNAMENLKQQIDKLRPKSGTAPVIAIDNIGGSQTAIGRLRTRLHLKQFYYLKGGFRALAQAHTTQEQLDIKRDAQKLETGVCD